MPLPRFVRNALLLFLLFFLLGEGAVVYVSYTLQQAQRQADAPERMVSGVIESIDVATSSFILETTRNQLPFHIEIHWNSATKAQQGYLLSNNGVAYAQGFLPGSVLQIAPGTAATVVYATDRTGFIAQEVLYEGILP